jgi:hypothetical protein
LSEFVADLTKANDSLLSSQRQRPLLERNPVAFWKGLAALELGVIAVLLYWLLSRA